jgi:hypothetical protein
MAGFSLYSSEDGYRLSTRKTLDAHAQHCIPCYLLVSLHDFNATPSLQHGEHVLVDDKNHGRTNATLASCMCQADRSFFVRWAADV